MAGTVRGGSGKSCEEHQPGQMCETRHREMADPRPRVGGIVDIVEGNERAVLILGSVTSLFRAHLGYSLGSEASHNSGNRGIPARGRGGGAVVYRDRPDGGHTIEDP